MARRSAGVRIAPSILSADFSRLGEDVKRVVDAGADWVHLDAMDGRFVPNITFGPSIVKALRSVTDATFDAHLMIHEPERYLAGFAEAGAEYITVHAEATTHLHRAVQQVRAAGAKAGAAVNPATPLSAVQHVLPDLDLLLVMTVDPGFGGQAFIPAMLPKVEEARRLLDAAGSPALLEVDGGVKPDNAALLRKAGADVLVAGSAVFASKGRIDDVLRALRG